MVHKFKTFMILIALSGCGVVNPMSDDDSTADAGDTPAITIEGDFINFVGFVSNAFEVTVDGAAYHDLEDFYTQESTRLPDKAAAAGLDASYKVSLDAQIGFQDLWTNMTVYISPVANHGYQGTARINADGSFQVKLPKEALDDTYRVRAVKRIGVVAEKEGESVRHCYNFSAMELSVNFSSSSKPIVLNAFETRLTTYSCVQAQGDGLEIPSSEGHGDKVTKNLLAPGMSKQQTLAILGRDDLTIKSSTKWCYATKTSQVCANNYATSCTCSVTFDNNGLLIAQDNVDASLLDILSW